MKNSNKQAKKLASAQQGRFIDGMVGRKANLHKAVARPVRIVAAETTAEDTAKANAVVTTPKPVKQNKTTTTRPKQRAVTLNRAVVSKPKAKTPKKSNLVIKTKLAETTAGRALRAQTIPRSSSVTRFGKENSTTIVPKVLPLKPKLRADEVAAPLSAPAAYTPQKKLSSATAASSLFDEHVNRALAKPSHTRHTKKRRGLRKTLTKPLVAAPVLMVALLIAGFTAYQSIPNVSMKVAASKAGFGASMPSIPAGFSVDGPVSAANGRVTVSFASNTDDRQATLHQQPSSLDSTSLSSGYLDEQGISYQTIEKKGTTIFIYNNSEATWINQGVWYSLEGDSQLSPAQIADLATSL